MVLCIISFSALKSLTEAAALQEEVLDTHEELILTHQAMSVVLSSLGRKEEAEKEMELAVECTNRLDSMEVPFDEERWLKTWEEHNWEMEPEGKFARKFDFTEVPVPITNVSR